MLELTELIGKGATRECYAHPFDKEKCVKVFQNPQKARNAFLEELDVYNKVHPILGNFICHYGSELVETNKGLGLISELIKDDDGKISKPLVSYVISGQMVPQIAQEINKFSQLLQENDLFFYDFNLMNFVVQKKGKTYRLCYIDMKSYNNYKSWSFLGLEQISKPIARYIVHRRLKRMYELLHLEMPKKK